jgi:hypothetical protein
MVLGVLAVEIIEVREKGEELRIEYRAGAPAKDL